MIEPKIFIKICNISSSNKETRSLNNSSNKYNNSSNNNNNKSNNRFYNSKRIRCLKTKTTISKTRPVVKTRKMIF